MEPREYGGDSLLWSDGCIQINPKATAIISQAVTPFHVALNIFCSIPGASPLRGFTPRYVLSPR